MGRITRSTLATLGVALVVLFAAACGSSSSSSSASSSSSTSVSGPTSGPGLTEPTTGTGSKVSGGTVYFTEASDTPPNYIFPMYSPQVCGEQNIDQMQILLYRPLYWYGNDYRPTVDYSYSIGQQPAVSNGGKTFTIKLNPYKWSNGETVTSRDLVFWMNVLKANPATEWCGYVPGFFPDNVTSYSAPNPSTFTITFNKAYNPTWVQYNELSQLTPLPLAWDRTSLSGCTANPCPAPSNTSSLPDTTKSGATAVYNFLNAQSKDLGTWATSPLWSVVNGPFKLTGFTTDGEVTMVPNPDYSGSPKASISKLVELPFTSEAAIYNLMRSGGTSAITVGTVPPQYAPQLGTLGAQGFDVNKAAYYGFNYFPINFNSNAPTSPGGEPIRYVFRQLYFRQALQQLVDQVGWTHAFLYGTANETWNPIPSTPPSPLVSASDVGGNPYPFDPSAASHLLSSHGWTVVPGGTTTCSNPTLCGTGINKGEGISFNIDYLSGIVSTQDEMNDLAAQAKKVGINIVLTTHPFDTVIATATACMPSQSTCKWTAQNWGAGWIYGPDYLPTGEDLFSTGAVANYGSYSDPQANSLIDATLTAAAGSESAALATYAKYIAQQLPVIFGPTEVGTFGTGAADVIDKKLGGYTANALGWMTPEQWYFTK